MTAHHRAIGQVGGLRTSQTTDAHARGRSSVEARKARLLAEIDPALPEAERLRRAEAAFKEQMARARLARKGGR